MRPASHFPFYWFAFSGRPIKIRRHTFKKRHFLGDPLNRDAGELLWKKLLIHGGAKDPHEMLQALLGDQGSGSEAGLRVGVASLLKDNGAAPPGAGAAAGAAPSQ